MDQGKYFETLPSSSSIPLPYWLPGASETKPLTFLFLVFPITSTFGRSVSRHPSHSRPL